MTAFGHLVKRPGPKRFLQQIRCASGLHAGAVSVSGNSPGSKKVIATAGDDSASHRVHLQHFVAEVADDLYRDLARLRHLERHARNGIRTTRPRPLGPAAPAVKVIRAGWRGRI